METRPSVYEGLATMRGEIVSVFNYPVDYYNLYLCPNCEKSVVFFTFMVKLICMRKDKEGQWRRVVLQKL